MDEAISLVVDEIPPDTAFISGSTPLSRKNLLRENLKNFSRYMEAIHKIDDFLSKIRHRHSKNLLYTGVKRIKQDDQNSKLAKKKCLSEENFIHDQKTGSNSQKAPLKKGAQGGASQALATDDMVLEEDRDDEQ